MAVRLSALCTGRTPGPSAVGRNSSTSIINSKCSHNSSSSSSHKGNSSSGSGSGGSSNTSKVNRYKSSVLDKNNY
jgi:hypothetical protein